MKAPAILSVRTAEPPWSRQMWPHFDDYFILLEQLLIEAKACQFAVTTQIRKHLFRFDRYCVTVSQGIDPHTVATLGWCMTWWGCGRPESILAPYSHPAFGLALWLAHLPGRPIGFLRERWLAVLARWLCDDLTVSRIAWRRGAEFMQGHGAYILHPGLVPLHHLASHHRIEKGKEVSSIFP